MIFVLIIEIKHECSLKVQVFVFFFELKKYAAAMNFLRILYRSSLIHQSKIATRSKSADAFSFPAEEVEDGGVDHLIFFFVAVVCAGGDDAEIAVG